MRSRTPDLPPHLLSLLGDKQTGESLTILSMGLGRDSVAMLCLAAQNELVADGKKIGLDDIDAVVFSDPGWEWPHTYQLIPRVRRVSEMAGVPFYVLKKPLRDGPLGWKVYYQQRELRSAQRAKDLRSIESKTPGLTARDVAAFKPPELARYLAPTSPKLIKAEKGRQQPWSDPSTRAASYIKSAKGQLKKKRGESDEERSSRLSQVFSLTAPLVFDPPWVEAGKTRPDGSPTSIHERAQSGYYHRRGPIIEDYSRLCRITLRRNAGCTANHKIHPINTRLVGEMSLEKYGLNNTQWGKAVKAGTRPKHRVLIGIAADETKRLKGADAAELVSKTIRPVYPLAEAGIEKADEEPILSSCGFEGVRKSGCVGCHFQPISWFWALKELQPESYRSIVEYENRALEYARQNGLKVKYLKGSSPLDDQVRRWASKNPDASTDAVLDKEYTRACNPGPHLPCEWVGQVILEDDGTAKGAYYGITESPRAENPSYRLGEVQDHVMMVLEESMELDLMGREEGYDVPYSRIPWTRRDGALHIDESNLGSLAEEISNEIEATEYRLSKEKGDKEYAGLLKQDLKALRSLLKRVEKDQRESRDRLLREDVLARLSDLPEVRGKDSVKFHVEGGTIALHHAQQWVGDMEERLAKSPVSALPEHLSELLKDDRRENPHRSPKSVVQSLVFLRSKFSEAQARAWARKHGFETPKTHVTKQTIRIRQVDPSKIKGGSFRTIVLSKGVKAVVGHV